MSTAKFDTLSTLDGSRTIPVSTVAQGTARAWVNFNGTGTVAIRAAFNVSSITDVGTGQYTVNFTTAMTDVNYATLVTSSVNANTADSAMNSNFVTTTSVLVASMTSTGSYADSSSVNVAVFR
jgi:hypothetical protein